MFQRKKALLLTIILIGAIFIPIEISGKNEIKSGTFEKNKSISHIKNDTHQVEFEPAYDTPRIRNLQNRSLNRNYSYKSDYREPILKTTSSNYYQKYSRFITGGQDIIYVPDDYPTIQSAVDNANSGDTIIVRDGTYTEAIYVFKPLTIMAEHPTGSCTVRQPNLDENAFWIESDYVSIIGFNIEGLKAHNGIVVTISNHSLIAENIIENFDFCIMVQECWNVVIENNSIGNYWGCEFMGLSLFSCYECKVENNTIYHNLDWGLFLRDSQRNIVIHNDFFGNTYNIRCDTSNNNTIMYNRLEMSYWAQIVFYYAYFNNFSHNDIVGGRFDGLWVLHSKYNFYYENEFFTSGVTITDSYQNTFVNNIVNNKELIILENESDIIIDESGGQIILLNCRNISISNQHMSEPLIGITLYNTSNSKILDSYITQAKYEGINGMYSHYNEIINCTLTHCDINLYLQECHSNIIKSSKVLQGEEDPAIIQSCNYNLITENNISDNYHGFKLYDSNYNNISNNIFGDNEAATGLLELYTSCYNYITDNSFILHSRGIYFKEWANYNYVFRNEILFANGIVMSFIEAEGNQIFHNSFGTGEIICGDTNFWDDGYPSGGNYWVGYNGADNDGDGIGDTPHSVDGGSYHIDNYPLMEPYGNFRVNTNGPYYAYVDDVVQFSGFACCGSSPYSWNWDFGDGNISYEKNPTHSYSTEGKFTLTLVVTDDEGNVSEHTSWSTIQFENSPPSKASISGPSYGGVGVLYDFSFVSDDPEGNEVWFYIDWGDGQVVEWRGFYGSGEDVVFSHIWDERDVYTIKAKARDGFNEESDWSYYEIRIPVNQQAHSYPLLELFKERFPILYDLMMKIMGGMFV